ncbi:MAG: hypothetical protein HQL32_01485 [Planctomycetes bacterium]|nr:hypothetical protein [Planctomycetota bacterium]
MLRYPLFLLTPLVFFFSSIATDGGLTHSIIVRPDGKMWAWGNNSYGQLGTGDHHKRPTPVEIGAGNIWVQAAAGEFHSLALDASGNVWSWGANHYKQLGHSVGTNKIPTPILIPSLDNISKICAGAYHSLAIKEDGSAISWGRNHAGQLGINTSVDSSLPQEVVQPASTALASGNLMAWYKMESHSGANAWDSSSPANNGTVIGTNFTQSKTQSPHSKGIMLSANAYIDVGLQASLNISGNAITLGAWVKITQSGNQTILSTDDDANNAGYGLMINDDMTFAMTHLAGSPTSSVSLNSLEHGNWHHIAATVHDASVKLFFDGTLDSEHFISLNSGLGVSGNGLELGRRSNEHQNYLTGAIDEIRVYNISLSDDEVYRLYNDDQRVFTDIAAGAAHSLVLTGQGEIFSCGSDGFGQLGIIGNTETTILKQVGNNNKWIGVAAGHNHSLGLTNRNFLNAWGKGYEGQLGQGNNNNKESPNMISGQVSYMDGGAEHTLYIRNDNDGIFITGANTVGQLSGTQGMGINSPVLNFSQLTNLNTVSAGSYHNYCQDRYGEVWAWGQNTHNQAGGGSAKHSQKLTSILPAYLSANEVILAPFSIDGVNSKLRAGGDEQIFFPLRATSNGTVSFNEISVDFLQGHTSDIEAFSVSLDGNTILGNYSIGSDNLVLNSISENLIDQTKEYIFSVNIIDYPQSSALKFKFDPAKNINMVTGLAYGAEKTKSFQITNLPNYSTKTLTLDGYDDYISFGPNFIFDISDEFSQSIWLKTGEDSDNMYIYSNQDSMGRGYKLAYNGSTDSLSIELKHSEPSDKLNEVISGLAINDNTWHHIMVTYDGSASSSGLHLYVNGADQATSIASDTLSGNLLSTEAFHLGNSPLASGNEFDGSLDEFALWNKALSANEIDNIYNHGSPADLSLHSASANLVGFFRLGEGNNFPDTNDYGGIMGDMDFMSIANITQKKKPKNNILKVGHQIEFSYAENFSANTIDNVVFNMDFSSMGNVEFNEIHIALDSGDSAAISSSEFLSPITGLSISGAYVAGNLIFNGFNENISEDIRNYEIKINIGSSWSSNLLKFQFDPERDLKMISGNTSSLAEEREINLLPNSPPPP